MTKRKGSPLVLVHVWEHSPSYLVPTEAPTVVIPQGMVEREPAENTTAPS